MTKNEQSQRLGQYLKSHREEASLSIKQVSKETKINGGILELLEKNDFDNLPSKTYVRGFVLNYCRLVNADRDLALGLLENEYQDKKSETEQHLETVGRKISQDYHQDRTAIENENPSELEKSLRSIVADFFTLLFRWKLPIAIFSVLLIIIFSSTIFFEAITLTELPHEKRLRNELKDTESDLFSMDANKSFRDNLMQEAQKEIAENYQQQEIPPDDEQKDEDSPSNGSRNYPEREFYQIKNSLFTLNPNATEIDQEDIYPSAFKNNIVQGKANVFVRALTGDTWLAYKIDNEPITNLVLKQGGILELRGELIRLYLGNINVTKIFYNNSLVLTESKTGVKSLVFPEARQQDFKLPLFINDANGILHTSEEYIKKMKQETQSLNSPI